MKNTTTRPYRTAAKIERAKQIRAAQWSSFDEHPNYYARPWSVLRQYNPWLDGGIGDADND